LRVSPGAWHTRQLATKKCYWPTLFYRMFVVIHLFASATAFRTAHSNGRVADLVTAVTLGGFLFAHELVWLDQLMAKRRCPISRG
jgi:hypothetical protein